MAQPWPLVRWLALVAVGELNRARMAQTHKFLAANDKTDLTPDAGITDSALGASVAERRDRAPAVITSIATELRSDVVDVA